MRYYIGLIHKEADSDYGVSFPDFPGVATAGKSLDDAQAMAEEALAPASRASRRGRSS
jgi:predicted RNase H-like HicB family nuclease